MDSFDSFPTFCVTVLGAAAAGKTALISAIVNNSYAEQGYVPTDFPNFFYRLIRLPVEDDAENMNEVNQRRLEKRNISYNKTDRMRNFVGDLYRMGGNKKSICVELEDTFACSRTDENRDVRKFFSMRRKFITVSGTVTDCTPFKHRDLMRIPSYFSKKYVSVSTGRMGFFICFDSNDDSSLRAAMVIHETFHLFLEKQLGTPDPLVFIVATKIDLQPQSATFKKTIASAERYCQSKLVRFWQVSALTSENIASMFYDMVRSIHDTPELWKVQIDEFTPDSLSSEFSD